MREGINYTRNSVKVVVDAYNGEYAFYVSDPTDPVVGVYSKIYPAFIAPYLRCRNSSGSTCAIL
ncbi:MAG: UPF0182 family protein [Syntrophaceticus schinkii]